MSDEARNKNHDIINNLKINDNWKERFQIIDKWYDDGVGIKITDRLKNIPYKERRNINVSIYIKNGGLGTFIASYIFGPFYYLFKGLWLKAIVYTLMIICFFGVIGIFMQSLQIVVWVGGALFAMLTPFDYFRLKILGRQW
ncbi:DUF2628 domain-containing protein [bacterium]|nr:DUF2628 domain-containing protein [bacterium]